MSSICAFSAVSKPTRIQFLRQIWFLRQRHIMKSGRKMYFNYWPGHHIFILNEFNPRFLFFHHRTGLLIRFPRCTSSSSGPNQEKENTSRRHPSVLIFGESIVGRKSTFSTDIQAIRRFLHERYPREPGHTGDLPTSRNRWRNRFRTSSPSRSSSPSLGN